VDLTLLLQRLFDAVFNGGIYASLALALVIIYRATGRFNFAQGEMATFAAFVSFLLLTGPRPFLRGGSVVGLIPGVPWPIPLAVLGAVLFGIVSGAATERILIRRLERKPDIASVNVTIGLLLTLNALTAELWGTGGRFFPAVFPAGPDDHLLIGGARLRFTSIGVWLTLLILVLLLVLLMQRTKPGLAFRAMSTNRASAELHGINIGRTLAAGWALAAGIGALAATLSANSVLLEPSMMLRVLIFSLAAATLGGLDSPKGAVVGGMIVALSQTLVPAYVPFVGNELSLLPAVIMMLLVLLIRPAGLFGTEQVERV
jgi:branched-chain amino acid transport system permease protein